MKSGLRLGYLTGTSVIAVAFAMPAFGQSAREPTAVEELVVTAQKREESLQDVPINITYVGAEQLQRQNITSVGELSRAAPSVSGGGAGGFSIRGIGTSGFARSAEDAVTLVLDGVPLGRAGINGLFDIDRVEVLNGPQGTLFGKNATAGVISVVTRAPQLNTFEVLAHADVGTFEYRSLRLTTNLPVTDQSALRVSVYHDGYGKIVYNAIKDKWSRNSETGIRARFRWEPTDKLSVNLSGDYAHNASNGILSQGTNARTTNTFAYIFPNAAGVALENQLVALCGVGASFGNYISCSDSNGGDKDGYKTITWGLASNIDYQMGAHTLTSITAFRYSQFGDFGLDADQNDVDIRPFNFLNRSLTPFRIKQFSQELRIASPTGQRVDYVAGIFYQNVRSKDHIDQGGALGALPPPLVLRRVSDVNIKSWNIAAFGQVTYNVRDDVRLIAGARLTRDEFHDVGTMSKPPCALPTICIYTDSFSLWPIDVKLDYTNLSWRLGAEYDIAPEVMLYATATRGYKAGFANDQLSPRVVNGVTLPPLAPIVVKPEIPTAYEIGMKGAFFDGRMGVNLAVFHTRIKDFQANISIPATGPGAVPSFGQGNAPWVQTRGVDLSVFGSPMEGLSLNAGLLYTDANYSENFVVACSTNYVIAPIQGCVPFTPGGTTGSKEVNGQLSGVPKWRLIVSGEYARPLVGDLEGFVQADVNYRTGTSTLVGDPLGETDPETRLGGRIGVRMADGRWSFAVFARNIQHKRWMSNVGRDFAAPGTVLTHGWSLNAVRIVGVTLDAQF